MSKFIQFNVQTSGAVQPAEPIAPLLINVEDIGSYAAAGIAAGVKSLAIILDGRYARAAAGAGVSGQILTLTFSTSTSAAAIPALVDGQPNPFVQALVAAMSQDVPGVAVYQLGNDQSILAANPNGVQMYIRSAVLS
jgi:hypothetical protein|tara:strand:- start:171 stop:581 length:411 start_codon:yes stop_codon:yes gene_type:complete